MTYLEKVREVKPNLKLEEIMEQCPEYFKLEPARYCDIKQIPDNCDECWNREILLEVAK